ncbi:hypothetical protein Bccel_3193 [Pseudobacteroides cellulosolvens ATCC 35603 = DSM 2933]|uniref:Uncharacterized protein n=1 Tax=Pseudobacteroides cellulosolvens ATCC 35603 = DSM 2933 TaxID=398512 RepID=A0A0L6JQ57_9FIRM|nr:hypothetical protein Bccel_3189 [Pseudobacteroides cellulosolvens ATCC 35603 = DSM 2933]KNY27922.1 hypothetical protein Bccel_3193 [Pseudobacteroides cellulosolvens ATCC 35603 = DSM 2933]
MKSNYKVCNGENKCMAMNNKSILDFNDYSTFKTEYDMRISSSKAEYFHSKI